MPYDFFVDRRNAALNLCIFGDVTFEDRLEMLDEMLFLIALHDIRRIKADYADMVAANPIADDLYFADLMQHHTGQMNGAASTLIFGKIHPALVNGIARLQAAGRHIRVFRKDPGHLRRISALRPGSRVAIPRKRAIVPHQPIRRVHDIVSDPKADMLYVDLFGELTFQDRIAAHDEMLFHVMRNDHRRIIFDLTQLSGSNTVQDELYFIDYLLHSPYMFQNQHMTVIHSSAHAATRYTTAALRGLGLAIRDLELPPAYVPVA